MWFIKQLLAVILPASILACNNYRARVLRVENCAGSDAVIFIEQPFEVKLSKNCELIPKGCINYKGFKAALANYKVLKDGVLAKEDTKFDICTKANDLSGEFREMFEIFGMSTQCPVSQNKTCNSDKKVDLNRYKSLLSMTKGRIIIDMDIQHDTGISCFYIEFEVTKK